MLTSYSVPAVDAIVLDTNVVLDWLVFKDPSAHTLGVAIAQGRVRWVATAAMRGEMLDVLQRGLAAERGASIVEALTNWDACVVPCDAPGAQPAATALCCTDPDDQKFVDLALATRARWLLSRDRAVLRLARRASARGMTITVPQAWIPPT